MLITLMLKKRMSGAGCAGHLLHDLQGVGALHLIAENLALALIDGGPLVALGRGVIAAGLHVILHPVRGGRTSDQVEFVLVQIKQDGVADHVTVGIAGDELLGLVDLEILEAVDAEIGEHLERVGTFDIQIRHVVRLIEKRAGLAPGTLLISPVGELVLHHGKRIGPDLRIAQTV